MRSKSKLFIFLFLIILLAGCYFGYKYFTKESRINTFYFDAWYYESPNIGSNCKIIESKGLSEISSYSFDSGNTWTSDNYRVYCEQKKETINILAKNDSGEIIGEKELDINNENNLSVLDYDNDLPFSFETPKISCAIGESVIVGYKLDSGIEEDFLLTVSNGMIANVNLIKSNYEKKDDIIVVKCNSIGSSELSATIGEYTAKTTIEVTETNNNIGNISFPNVNYVCTVGDKITTTIVANGKNETTHVDNFYSSNGNVLLKKHPSLAAKCDNCQTIEISCNTLGSSVITAVSSDGAITSSNVLVKSTDANGKLIYNSSESYALFDKSSYMCSVGSKITATINVKSAGLETISNYNSLNTKIVSINKLEEAQSDSKKVEINCIEEGNAVITATLSNGSVTSSNVTVVKSTVLSSLREKTAAMASVTAETIEYEKTSYTCDVGDVINTYIISKAPTGSKSEIASYGASNPSLVSVKKNIYIKGVISGENGSGEYVSVSCLKNGTTYIIGATKSGKTVKAKIVVNNPPITYDKSLYTCEIGDTISAVIKTNFDGTSKNPSVVNYSSQYSSVADIIQDPNNMIRCLNCTLMKIICKDVGTTIIGARSSKGDKTSAKVVVSSKNSIYYDSNDITCNVGEKVTSVITTTSVSENKIHVVASFSSLDKSIASITKHPSLSVACINCLATQISCNKVGTTTLEATDTLGKKTTTKVTVRNDKTINFSQDTYECGVGRTIDVIVEDTVDNSKIPNIKSISSSNTSIATISKSSNQNFDSSTPFPGVVSKGVRYTVKCNNIGSVTINAQSDNGNKASAVVAVKGPASVYFENSGYYCKVGETLNVSLLAYTDTYKVDTIKSYSSSDKGAVTLINNDKLLSYKAACSNIKAYGGTLSSKCISLDDFVATTSHSFSIKCNKIGNYSVSVTSASGVTGRAEVYVRESGTIAFDKTSYVCQEGQSMSLNINAFDEKGIKVGVSNFYSNNANIVSISKNSCTLPECKSHVISCKKAGTTILNSSSALGAKSTATVKVVPKSIAYSESSYSCNVGQSFTLLINTFGDNVALSNYSSSDSSIASFVDLLPTDYQAYCTGCYTKRVKCIKKGRAILGARSSTGGINTVYITVN